MIDRGLDRFWIATGSAAPLRLLVWRRDQPAPAEHRLDRPFAIVGRSAPADLVLDHPQISRRHAFVQAVGPRAYCLDLGSRTALAWNGRSRRSGWIEPGRPVEIGPYRIGLAAAGLPAPSAAITDPARFGPADVPPARFLLEPNQTPGHTRHPQVIDRTFTLVGRAPESDLRLGDLSISRYHCILIRLGAELWMVDLGGRGGVEVNGHPAPWRRLDDASLLRLGRYLFTVRRLPAPNPAEDLDPMALPVAADRGPMATPLPPANLPARLAELPALLHPPALPAPATPFPPLALEGPQHAELARLAESMIAPLVDQITMMQHHMLDQYHQSMMEMVAVFTRLHQEQQGLVDRELRKIRRLTREVRSLRRELDEQRRAASPAGRPSLAPGGEPQAIEPPDPIASALRAGHTPQAQGNPEEYRAAQARLIARMTELQQERQGRWQRLLGRLGAGSVENER